MAEMFGGGGGDSPFSDFFKTFFGGMGGGGIDRRAAAAARGRAARKGQDVEHPFELDLEDAIRGSVQRLQLRHDGHARTVEVRIPAGVTDGSRVRVAGEGGRGAGSAAERRLVSARAAEAASGVRREGPRRLHARARAGADRRCSAAKSTW